MIDENFNITYTSENIATQFTLTHSTILKWINYCIKKFPQLKDSFQVIPNIKGKAYIVDEAGYEYLCNRYKGMKPASQEYEFKHCIIPFLNAMGYDVEYQKTFLKYRVDFYIPKINMVIEHDEDYHRQKKVSEYDIKRETEIKAFTGCVFVRIPARLDTISALGYISEAVFQIRLKRQNTQVFQFESTKTKELKSYKNNNINELKMVEGRNVYEITKTT